MHTFGDPPRVRDSGADLGIGLHGLTRAGGGCWNRVTWGNLILGIHAAKQVLAGPIALRELKTKLILRSTKLGIRSTKLFVRSTIVAAGSANPIARSTKLLVRSTKRIAGSTKLIVRSTNRIARSTKVIAHRAQVIDRP